MFCSLYNYVGTTNTTLLSSFVFSCDLLHNRQHKFPIHQLHSTARVNFLRDFSTVQNGIHNVIMEQDDVTMRKFKILVGEKKSIVLSQSKRNLRFHSISILLLLSPLTKKTHIHSVREECNQHNPFSRLWHRNGSNASSKLVCSNVYLWKCFIVR